MIFPDDRPIGGNPSPDAARATKSALLTRRELLRRGALLGAGAPVLLSLAKSAGAALPLRGNLARFEPTTGCYIGAFIERDFTVRGNIAAFEELTKKKHASYFTYVGYGRPFPADWVMRVTRSGAAPHIAFEPNNGLAEVSDTAYLRAWARDAARSRVPIFLRWASEMNGAWINHRYGGDDRMYREKFALVSRVMKEEAPNVVMLWTPFAEPARTIPLFYPGDEWVDWVGVNIYSVFVNNGDPSRDAADKDPVDFLRGVYSLYSDRKPIHISEYAATIWCKGTGRETVDWAIDKMRRFYTAIRDEFPRVKSVNWFCLNAVKAGLANNNYSILDDGRMLAAYREMVADRHFLSRVPFDPSPWPTQVRAGTTLGAQGLALRPESSEDWLATNAAIATAINEPWLRGLKNGEVVSGALDLWAQLPVGMDPLGILWQLDGRTIALKNTQPFRVTVPRERLVEGEHTAQIVVRLRDGTESRSPLISFVVE